MSKSVQTVSIRIVLFIDLIPFEIFIEYPLYWLDELHKINGICGLSVKIELNSIST
jgi:hypothetical protein